jgi:hypothetical protein
MTVTSGVSGKPGLDGCAVGYRFGKRASYGRAPDPMAGAPEISREDRHRPFCAAGVIARGSGSVNRVAVAARLETSVLSSKGVGQVAINTDGSEQLFDLFERQPLLALQCFDLAQQLGSEGPMLDATSFAGAGHFHMARLSKGSSNFNGKRDGSPEIVSGKPQLQYLNHYYPNCLV